MTRQSSFWDWITNSWEGTQIFLRRKAAQLYLPSYPVLLPKHWSSSCLPPSSADPRRGAPAAALSSEHRGNVMLSLRDYVRPRRDSESRRWRPPGPACWGLRCATPGNSCIYRSSSRHFARRCVIRCALLHGYKYLKRDKNLSWWLCTDKETGCFWSELVDIVHCGHRDDWLLVWTIVLFSPSLASVLRSQVTKDTLTVWTQRPESETLRHRGYVIHASSLHTSHTFNHTGGPKQEWMLQFNIFAMAQNNSNQRIHCLDAFIFQQNSFFIEWGDPSIENSKISGVCSLQEEYIFALSHQIYSYE